MSIDNHLLIESDARGSEAGDSINLLFVSIYLLLFAFFVVLNAISNTDTVRVEAALGSVNATFTPEKQPRSPLTDLLNAGDQVMGNDKFRDQVHGIFQSLLDSPDFIASRDGDTLRITLPAHYLFYDLSPRLREERADLLERLSAVLAMSPSGLRQEIQIMLGTGADLPEMRGLATDLQVMRAGAFAAELTSRGTLANAITIGLTGGDPDAIHLTFLTSRHGSRVVD
ncbi:MAG: flagellar motor protein MotB [Sphingomonadales bacterium]